MQAARPVVTIGIDFGTSAIKMAYREFGAKHSVLIPHTKPPTAARDFVWPASVYVHGNKLHFAGGPSGDGVIAIQWLKMLLRGEGAEQSELLTQMQERVQQLGHAADELATLLLAYLMNVSRSTVARRYEKDGLSEPEFTYHVDAPMESLLPDKFGPNHAADQIRTRFELAAMWAEKLSHRLSFDTPLARSDAKAAFEEVRAAFPSVEDDAGRVVFVMPETHAAVCGITTHGGLEPGVYAAVDIGAGTTDVAIFRYVRDPQTNRRSVVYYGDCVRPEAATQADRLIRNGLRKKFPALEKPLKGAAGLERAREVKESTGHSTSCGGQRVGLSEQEIDSLVKELGDNLFHHYRKTLCQSLLTKDDRALRNSFDIVLLGGGSRFRPFRDRFNKQVPEPLYQELKLVHHPIRDPAVQGISGHLHPMNESESYLFTVVHGLSLHPRLVGNFVRPDEVSDVPPPDADYGVWIRDDDD